MKRTRYWRKKQRFEEGCGGAWIYERIYMSEYKLDVNVIKIERTIVYNRNPAHYQLLEGAERDDTEVRCRRERKKKRAEVHVAVIYKQTMIKEEEKRDEKLIFSLVFFLASAKKWVRDFQLSSVGSGVSPDTSI